jgi:hypothetical protein
VHNRIDRRQSQRRAAFQIGVDGRRPHGLQPAVGGCRACEAEYLVAILHKFRDQAAAEQAGASRDEDLHCDQPFVSELRIDRRAFSRICSRSTEAGGAVSRSRAVTMIAKSCESGEPIAQRDCHFIYSDHLLKSVTGQERTSRPKRSRYFRVDVGRT